MARVRREAAIDLDDPVLVEGLPGVGLVGKLAVDHLVDELDMTHVASVECAGVPKIAVYEQDDRTVRAPVRIYADETTDLLAIQSDVPVSEEASSDFAACITDWIRKQDALPAYLSGMPIDHRSEVDTPSVFGVGAGDTAGLLDAHNIDRPPEQGAISGPTGALLHEAAVSGLDAVGLVVETDPKFPDPAAARQAIVQAIEPLADVDVSTQSLVAHAEEIQRKKRRLAQHMGEASEEESTQARPLRMFQ